MSSSPGVRTGGLAVAGILLLSGCSGGGAKKTQSSSTLPTVSPATTLSPSTTPPSTARPRRQRRPCLAHMSSRRATPWTTLPSSSASRRATGSSQQDQEPRPHRSGPSTHHPACHGRRRFDRPGLDHGPETGDNLDNDTQIAKTATQGARPVESRGSPGWCGW